MDFPSPCGSGPRPRYSVEQQSPTPYHPFSMIRKTYRQATDPNASPGRRCSGRIYNAAIHEDPAGRKKLELELLDPEDVDLEELVPVDWIPSNWDPEGSEPLKILCAGGKVMVIDPIEPARLGSKRTHARSQSPSPDKRQKTEGRPPKRKEAPDGTQHAPFEIESSPEPAPRKASKRARTDHRCPTPPAPSRHPVKSGVAPVDVEPELCDEQRRVVELILQGHNVFYTGSAGCGKSTVLRAFVKELKAQGKKVRITAPTNIAALNIGGITT
ncbi:hypothetical protein BU26DRAFT_44171 [Trematosphaeria pertusa]|uniref:ATP-dependent DNA helicase n=1 Tax=Trematosphaeria pertusa TaxID=390896 RepID=A0A6A6J5E9_9PLEO|nr:uncharacterized protein BU26DRAFT_44171 [Trematosphaeria pertusa]KAF2257452.1 hypothetical protein BU26DRAFT_44171 [Trematosphaeria pertusa]